MIARSGKSCSVMLVSATQERVSVLRADVGLGERLDPERLARAERLSVAALIRRPAGTWDATEDAGRAREGLGLLVMEGLLVRRLGLKERHGAELLSAGDLLQPAAHDGEEATLPFEATWRVLTPLCLAVLDLPWMTRMAPFPEVTATLVDRVMTRSRRLASLLTINHHHKLEERLRLLLWELADRYGRVGTGSVRLDLALTHEIVADLIGAHRPSVSVAVGRLERAGDLRREGRTWHLTGAPPVSGGMTIGSHLRA